ncbi:MAG: hypothetical protein DPW09_03110 [Anaerolineae bacterium]|nr:hypothetical protein [Anaerolineae bacterium]
MTWQVYRLVFRLESPLHIGWRKISNLMQTRSYVPGRIWWGAVTAGLTQWLGKTDYRQTGEWVQENLRFGYFFPAENIDDPLYPVQSAGETVYGQNKLSESVFERRFLNALASTAIAHEANVAEEASLHEVEFLTPSLNLGQPVYLVGHLFVHQNEEIAIRNDDVEVQGLSLFSQVIASLQIGGERRYGFGRLTLCRSECRRVSDIFGYLLNQQDGQCCVTVPARRPLLAHAIAGGLRLNGSIEPLVSREWAQQSGPGRQVTLLGLCYVPGSTVASDTTFTIGQYGIWEQGG